MRCVLYVDRVDMAHFNTTYTIAVINSWEKLYKFINEIFV